MHLLFLLHYKAIRLPTSHALLTLPPLSYNILGPSLPTTFCSLPSPSDESHAAPKFTSQLMNLCCGMLQCELLTIHMICSNEPMQHQDARTSAGIGSI